MKVIIKILSAIITYALINTVCVFAELEINKIDINTSNNQKISEKIEKLNAAFYNDFQIKILKVNNYVLQDGVWYTYVYDKFLSTGLGEIPNQKDLKDEGIDFKNDILLLDDSIGVGFITEYKKVKLINDEIITNISNKEAFLKELVYEKGYSQNDTDELFLKLKNKTLEITKGLNDANKIYKIYDYILENTEYSKKFDVNKKEIFSGIYTFENKNGVCSGYAKLFLYMLSFAGIDDVKMIKGNVIDIENFTDYGHAWIRIGDKYFDPTFDDPIGYQNTKTFGEYSYFGLPQDVFYANRFDYGTMPSDLENTSLIFRKQLVNDKYELLANKYLNKSYNLLKNIDSLKNVELSLN
ncbi:MAG: transglutaminase domain-containing protein [Candidatus Gracilibacteria bacterium]|nr:transglutaminase domain-containing protein [Candidatus Gracilibacteria bacterium]